MKLWFRQNLLNHHVRAIAKTVDDVQNGIAAIVLQHAHARAIDQRVHALSREVVGVVERGEFWRCGKLAGHALGADVYFGEVNSRLVLSAERPALALRTGRFVSTTHHCAVFPKMDKQLDQRVYLLVPRFIRKPTIILSEHRLNTSGGRIG